VGKVMGEFKDGDLHSGSKTGPVVKDRKQAMSARALEDLSGWLGDKQAAE
jgi:hypothetical protein